jgi:hydrogenase nickel incorporation protein HypA/HybF
MHEWALAESVLETVKKENKKQPGRVTRVLVLFGELQQVDREIFQGGLRELARDYDFDPGVVVVETEPAQFLCLACGVPWKLSDQPEIGEDQLEAIHFLPEASHAHLRCPHCGSADFRIQQGRGVSIASIDIETEQ